MSTSCAGPVSYSVVNRSTVRLRQSVKVTESDDRHQLVGVAELSEFTDRSGPVESETETAGVAAKQHVTTQFT